MVKDFILQSRNTSRFFRRFWYSSAVFLLSACLSAAWFGYISYQQTIQSTAKSLWFPFRTDTLLTEGDGADALSTVAKQDKDIRLSFIEGILSDENNAKTFSSNPTLFLRASIQSDLILRDRLLQRLREEVHNVDSISLARMQALLELDLNAGMQQLLKTVNSAGGYRLINALGISKIAKYIAKLNKNQIKLGVALLVEMIIKTADAGLLGPLSQALAPLANKLDTHQVEQVVAHYLEMIGKPTNADQLKALIEGLASLANQLNEHQIEQVVAHYLEMIGKTADADQFLALDEGLASLASKLNEHLLAQVVAHYFSMTLKTTDVYLLGILSKRLAPLVNKLHDDQAAQVVAHYLEMIGKTTDVYLLRALNESLTSLASKLNEDLVAQVVSHYLEMIGKSMDADQIQALDNGLVSLANRLDEHQATQVIARYIERIIKTTYVQKLLALSEELAPLVNKLDERQAKQLASHYIEIIGQTKDADQLQALGGELASLASKLDEHQVAQVVAHYIEIIDQTKNVRRSLVLSGELARLVKKLDEHQVEQVVARSIETIINTADTFQLLALSGGFAPLTKKLDELQATQVSAHYIERIVQTTDNHQLRALGNGLANITARLDDTVVKSLAVTLPTTFHDGLTGAQQAALAEPANTIIPRLALSGNLAKTWLAMSNIPFIDREAVAASIRKHYPDAPREEEGIWIFLQWANHHFGLSRPDSAELVPAVMYIFLLPLLVLFSGRKLLHIVSGRKLVALQLSKLKYARDRKPLDLRFLGYTADQANIHWGALGNDERLYEQRFLAMDLIFAPIYGLAFLYALLLASEYLGEPLPSAWFMILVGTMVLADWLENAIHFQQLKRLNPQGGGLQNNWILIASLATQIKLISMASAIALLFYFSGQLMLF